MTTKRTSGGSPITTDQSDLQSGLEDKSLKPAEGKGAAGPILAEPKRDPDPEAVGVPETAREAPDAPVVTVKVLVAHFFGDHTPGDVIEVPQWEAAQIVSSRMGDYITDKG